jgi:hypothetical protein
MAAMRPLPVGSDFASIDSTGRGWVAKGSLSRLPPTPRLRLPSSGEIPSRFCDFSSLCGQENFAPIDRHGEQSQAIQTKPRQQTPSLGCFALFAVTVAVRRANFRDNSKRYHILLFSETEFRKIAHQKFSESRPSTNVTTA